ncbi:PEP-CTERM sorting domain-containing protein [Pseudoduganella chitinolytica]|uniref:PEP-CTERM sorting domain-containing protein n=1 Tax=Pseudoduganella chitinolytica TaxID=34070 RepID=A0ABY8BG86_9BURK|nr:PEP-CTERM sorting domain-containing protein [Pseudoduganella chitinolytica]WEF34919.1 PEP-CTERM sorting domain-containing protein [Pseudoduganella chitinolytica]
MKLVHSLGLVVLLGIVSLPASAVTQSVTASSTDQFWYQNAGSFEIGRISLQYGTNRIVDIDTSVWLVDQGWGNQSPLENAVYVGLFNGGAQLVQIRVAGASHDGSTQTYDLAENADDYTQLNTALARLDWAAYPDMTVRFYTHAAGYPGWELHTRDASMVVTSVPEPGAYAMLLAGMGVLGWGGARRKRGSR